MKSLLIVSGLAVLLAACGTAPVKSNVTVVSAATIEIPPLPEKTTLLQVQWQVLNRGDLIVQLEQLGIITKQQATQMLANMPKTPQTDDYALFALNAQQLANLVHNLEALKEYIDEQNIVIRTLITETQATQNQALTTSK